MATPVPSFSGPALRALRHSAGLTQLELAEQIGTSNTAIHRWEAGSRVPAPVWLGRLAAGLGVDVEQLTGPVEPTLVSMRLRRGLTQREVANRVGVSGMTVGRLERGHVSLAPVMARALARALGARVGEVRAAYEHGKPAGG